jgi:hypothetical protein
MGKRLHQEAMMDDRIHRDHANPDHKDLSISLSSDVSLEELIGSWMAVYYSPSVWHVGHHGFALAVCPARVHIVRTQSATMNGLACIEFDNS